MDKRKSLVIYILVFFSFTALYLTNLDGWLIHDDEGSDFYEVWQFQKGKKPGVDYIAEQQPAFLLYGSSVIDIFGRSAWHLRMSCTIQVLLGALVLASAIYQLWGPGTAILAIGLLLSNSILFYQARLFRPDTIMIAWEMAALGAALMAVLKQKPCWWAFTGIFYGVAILSKPFGVFPLIGAGLFFIDDLRQNRSSWKIIGINLAFFIIPLTIVGLGMNAWFYYRMGFYYLEPFQQHLSIGQDTTLLVRFARTTIFYHFLVLQHPILLFSIPLWIINAKQHWLTNPIYKYLLFQLPVPFVFLLMKRPMFQRYLIFLIPVFVVLSAWQINKQLERSGKNHIFVKKYASLITLLIIVFAFFTSRPGITESLFRRENDTLQLASIVTENSNATDIVISDYASINFHAGRDSIYEASIIAGGRISEQIITGRLLIDRIEDKDVKLVLIHTAGGEPEPHQLARLADYDQFKDYLFTHFEQMETFDRAGQIIDIYKNKN